MLRGRTRDTSRKKLGELRLGAMHFASDSSLSSSPTAATKLVVKPSVLSLRDSQSINPTSTKISSSSLSSRPQLSLSRGPIFVPTAEGSEYFKTDVTGVNRAGFRYIPAGISPVGDALPCRTIETTPRTYRVSWEDRSPSITVTKDGLGLYGSGGFCSARCNAPMVEGKWYMEIRILRGGGERYPLKVRSEESHVRLGWGRREAPLNGPVGLDGYSYGYRDKTGEKVTLSRPRHYGRPFGTGDVIGMYISLPPRREACKSDPFDPAHLKRERIAINLQGQEMFETLEYPQSKEMASLMDGSGLVTSSDPSTSKKILGKTLQRSGRSLTNKSSAAPLHPPPILQGSRIAFFVNGESQGIAFQDMYDYLQPRQSDTQYKDTQYKKKSTCEGMKQHWENPFNDGWLGYYPFISLFNDACVRINTGPNFDFPPPNNIDTLLDGAPASAKDTGERMWRPACERYLEFMAEQWALDKIEEREAREELMRVTEMEKVMTARKAEQERKRKAAKARKCAKLVAGAGQQQALYATSGSVNAGRVNVKPSSLPALTDPGKPSRMHRASIYETGGKAFADNSYARKSKFSHEAQGRQNANLETPAFDQCQYQPIKLPESFYKRYNNWIPSDHEAPSTTPTPVNDPYKYQLVKLPEAFYERYNNWVSSNTSTTPTP